MLLLAGAFALTACTDDNESNPTLTQPTQFVLNEFAVNGNIDLERTASSPWMRLTPVVRMWN